MRSSSYTPPDHPNYQPILHALAQLFATYQRDGYVTFAHETAVYYGMPTRR